MSQPVVDTLRLCDLLRKTGMEREQAEGMARVLGEELGEHVAVQGDVQSGFRQVRSDLGAEIQKVRSDLGAEIEKVRCDLGAEIQKVRSDLGAEIQQVRHDLGTEIQQVRNDLGGEIQQVRHDLGARIQAVDGKIDSVHSMLKFLGTGVGLALAFLAVIVAMGIRAPSSGAWNAPAPPAAHGSAPATSPPAP